MCRIDLRALQNPMATLRTAALVDKEKTNTLDVENAVELAGRRAHLTACSRKTLPPFIGVAGRVEHCVDRCCIPCMLVKDGIREAAY